MHVSALGTGVTVVRTFEQVSNVCAFGSVSDSCIYVDMVYDSCACIWISVCAFDLVRYLIVVYFDRCMTIVHAFEQVCVCI